jgi:hypothetical protein
VTFDASYPHALAIYCSDGRFTEPVEALLRKLGHERLDTLTIPGGPGLFDMWTAGFAQSIVVRDAATFLIEAHAIRHVVLVQHEGCGFYKRRYPDTPPEEIVERQVLDMGHAGKAIREVSPSVEVARFFASVVDGRVAFRPT